MEATKWDDEVVEARMDSRRIGLGPQEVPVDGEWYVMRSETWRKGMGSKRPISQKITQSVKYIRRRQADGAWPNFEVAKVRKDGDDGSVTWHMLGRWT